jgi:hypothetical protein
MFLKFNGDGYAQEVGKLKLGKDQHSLGNTVSL